MKTVSLTIYTFDELSEPSKRIALDRFADINTCGYPWWNDTYEDAGSVGITINEFDLDNYFIKIYIEDCYYTAKLILQNYGEVCKTFVKANTFINEWDKLVNQCSDGITLNKVAEHNIEDFDLMADKLETDFKIGMRSCYLEILKADFDYLTSDQTIKESIISNEYHFTSDGKFYPLN